MLEAIARALRLDDAESSHLVALARAAHAATGQAPTGVRNEHMDFIAANPLGRALYVPVLADHV